MADYATIIRIGKILARATSPEKEEAATALNQTYKRMVKEQVTIKDLLTLPDEDLYQDTLVKLVSVILDNDSTLSMSSKRKLYAEYMRLITDRFSPVYGQQKQNSNSESKSEQGSREEEARNYEERTGYKKSSSREYSQENENTQKQENEKTKEQEYTKQNQPRNDDWLQYIRPHFQRGGVFWLIFHYPSEMSRYFMASFLWGMAMSFILILALAILFAFLHTKPSINPELKPVFCFLAAVGTLWRFSLFVKRIAS